MIYTKAKVVTDTTVKLEFEVEMGYDEFQSIQCCELDGADQTAYLKLCELIKDAVRRA